VANPKGQYMVDMSTSYIEQVQAITTLRSGKVVDIHVEERKDEQNKALQNLHREKGKEVSTEASSSSTPIFKMPYEPRIPYPKCLNTSSHFRKQGEKIQDVKEVFGQVKINLPLLDAIKQVLAYARFFKDLCTQKRTIRSHIPEKVYLIEQVSFLIHYNNPPKFKDPSALTIACVIGDRAIDKALLDLEAGVNFLPHPLQQPSKVQGPKCSYNCLCRW
jgi:hypothetical protein